MKSSTFELSPYSAVNLALVVTSAISLFVYLIVLWKTYTLPEVEEIVSRVSRNPAISAKVGPEPSLGWNFWVKVQRGHNRYQKLTAQLPLNGDSESLLVLVRAAIREEGVRITHITIKDGERYIRVKGRSVLVR